MKVTFIIKKSAKRYDTESTATIYLRLRDGRRLDSVAQTALSINPNLWDEKNECVKSKAVCDPKLRSETNEELRKLKGFIEKEYNRDKDNLDKDWLKAALVRYYNPDKFTPEGEKKQTFEQLFDEFLEKHRLSEVRKKAFGDQTVCTDRGEDNSHLHRCPEIEQWAMDVYDWCARRYGRENIIGFQVHLDESSPHIHALIVPVGSRKSGRECVMWSAKFGKNKYEYGQILKEMHTSLYEEVGSKYGLDRGDSIDGRQVQHLGKRDYIRKLNKDIQQSEKAIKGLKTMLTNLQTQIEERQKQLENLDGKLRSGKIHLQDYEDERKSLQRQIADLHNKVYDKMAAIGRKESELAKLTKEVDAVNSVIQPFRNHKIEFDPPRITEKPPLFGVDKWLDKQNDQISKRFTSIVRKIESLYMQDAERQVKTAQKNVLADYRELNQLRGDYESLTDSSHQQDFAYRQLLDQLSIPSMRVQVLAIADALIGGRPIPSSGGGGGTTSDLRWDGRNPDEEEDAYRRRCLLQASKMVGRNGMKRKR